MPTNSEQFEFWVAHDHPERPFDHGVFVCDCDACRLATKATAKTNPRFTLIIRTNLDRIGVTAEYMSEVWERDGCIEALLYLQGDWIRDVGSATHQLPNGARWWSLTLEERADRRRALRRVAPGAVGIPRLGAPAGC